MRSSRFLSSRRALPIVTAAVVTLAGLGIVSPASAETPALGVVSTNQQTSTPLGDEAPANFTIANVKVGANVRQGPGLDQKILGTAALGSTVQSTGKRTKTGALEWKEVKFGTGTGWIASTKLKAAGVTPPAPAAPAAPVVTNLADEAPGKYTVSGLPASSQLNVRQNPGVGQTILGGLPEGTTVESTGKHANVGTREWKQVKFKNSTGWVSTRYLAKAS